MNAAQQRAEWLRLNAGLNQLSRGIADLLVGGGPAAIDRIGPRLRRYGEAKADFDSLVSRGKITARADNV